MYDGFWNPQIDLNTRLSWTTNNTAQVYSITLNAFGAIRAAMSTAGISGKPFWVTEIGWESTSSVPGSSIANLRSFYLNFLHFSLQTPFFYQTSSIPVPPPNRIFYFTVRDVPAQSETFGLYTSSSTLSPKFTK